MSYYDTLEIRDPAVRDADLWRALPGQIAYAQRQSPAFARILADVDAATVTNRDALARLPVTRKAELQDLQQQQRPFGGFTTVAPGELARIFQSPGPLYDPEGRRPDYWRLARALFAAGFRRGELIHNAFSYHLTPAGSMLETGAHALGCAVVPAGTGQTELQITAMADLKPDGYVGTPSFLKILLEKAAVLGAEISSLKRALVTAEALPPSLRQDLQQYGLQVFQCYVTADLGLIAYETSALEGMVVDEGVLIEIVRPGTGDPVPAGEIGELVVTTLTPEYPLIRFGTGDLSAILPGASPCGRTHTRIRGWLGRADQTTKVKGMFVHPSQVAAVLKRYPQLVKGRLVVDSKDHADVMTLHGELAGNPTADLEQAVMASLREVCKVRGQVVFTAPGTLPNDGKVIDDIRTYE